MGAFLVESEEPRVIWITCPECGAKIGIVLSVGKGPAAIERPTTMREPAAAWPPSGFAERLAASGIDVALLNVEEREDITVITPKKFLGDLWGPINEVIRSLGGNWIREGRQSRWEISKQDQG